VSRGTPDRRDIDRGLRREVLVWVLTAASALLIALFLLGYIKP
jgi:hypothetical protein